MRGEGITDVLTNDAHFEQKAIFPGAWWYAAANLFDYRAVHAVTHPIILPMR
jgi:hypothetical protein